MINKLKQQMINYSVGKEEVVEHLLIFIAMSCIPVAHQPIYAKHYDV